jgi:hypothetical protein
MTLTALHTPTIGIAQILREGNRYFVPPHQRDFSWSEDEIGQLIGDMEDARRGNQDEYFLGLMVFMPSTTREYTILDGQQRLATATVLLSAIRSWLLARDYGEDATKIQSDYIAERQLGGSDEVPRIVLNEINNPVFEQSVVRQCALEDIEKALDQLPRYHPNRRLYEAVLCCRRRVQELADGCTGDAARYLFGMVHYLENNVKIVRLVVPNEANAYTVFETLNYRGLDLSVLDLIKNHLFGRAGSDVRLRDIKARWSQMTSNLSNLRADDFLKAWWTSRYGRVQTALMFPKFKDKVTAPTSVVKVSEDMLEASDQYAAMEIADDTIWSVISEKRRESIRSLKILGAQQVHPILLSALKKFPPQELERLLWLLETLIVRYQLIGGGRTGRLEISCASLAHAIHEGKIATAGAAKTHLRDIYPSDDEFKEAFRIKEETNSRKAIYLLRHLEIQAMRTKNRREGGIEHDPRETLTIEHVLPKKPGEAWKQALARDSEFYEDCVNRLGNMCLLTSVNRALGNKAFDAKKTLFAQSDLVLTQEVAGYRRWDRRSVERRQARLAALATAVWRFG